MSDEIDRLRSVLAVGAIAVPLTNQRRREFYMADVIGGPLFGQAPSPFPVA